MIRCGIIGASGYTGSTLLRLCLAHPSIDVVYLGSTQHDGVPVYKVLPEFHGSELVFTIFDPSSIPDIDILFLALPHGISQSWMDQLMGSKCRIIDLSADFRLSDQSVYESVYATSHQNFDLLDQFSYGLPEVYTQDIRNKPHCAVPGCYATAMNLALFPLANANRLSGQIIIDGKSGVSGAGKSLKYSNLFVEANETVTPYGTFYHRHVAEVAQVCGANVFFSPHLMPMTAGILCTHYIEKPSGMNQADVMSMFESVYNEAAFVSVFDQLYFPSTRSVVGTNNCHIAVHCFPESQWIVLFSVLDNLMKGAAGQAIQCMNIMLGFNETKGLV